MINDFPTHIPNNFKYHTHHFLHGVIDFTVDALNLKTGKAIKILSYLKVAKAFGVDNYYVEDNDSSENSAVIISDGHVKTVHIESTKIGIVNVVKELSNVWRDILLKTICRGALNENSEPILCVSLPLVYKTLFGVELNQQQKLDLGIVIRDDIPEVRTRPKVLTIHSETKTPI